MPGLLQNEPFPVATPGVLLSLLVSSCLQGLALQDQLDLFGIQCLIHEQSICQVLVLLAMSLQQGFGPLIRLLETVREKMVRNIIMGTEVFFLCFMVSSDLTDLQ